MENQKQMIKKKRIQMMRMIQTMVVRLEMVILNLCLFYYVPSIGYGDKKNYVILADPT